MSIFTWSTVWSPAPTWWSWPKTAKPQNMEVSTPGLIIILYRMGECNICLGFRFQVFPHFPQGKLSERNTWVLVKLPRAGEARHVAPALRLVIFTRSRIFRSLLYIITKEVPVVYFRIVLIRVDPYAWCTSFFRVFDPQWLRAAFSWTATGNRASLILYRAQKFDIIIEATTGNTSALRRLHSQLL